MDIATAIKSLFPEAEFVIKDNDYEELLWISTDISKPSRQELEERWEQLQRESRRALIREQRRQLLASGITFCGTHFATDPESRALITGAVLDAEDLPANEIVDWQAPQPDGGHAWQDLEAIRVRALGKAVAHYTRRLFQVQRAKEQAFDAGEAPETVAWPSHVYDCTDDLPATEIDASNAGSALGNDDNGSQIELGTVLVGIG
ncbi:MAG: DUF4376 domain-containing protein [Ectothiorhodospiraceae bacterium]|nr:DUF4376 domain-containing protein [Ectothiorhodospiraceae bacterium]